MKYNMSFKDDHGIGYAIESYPADDGDEVIYRISEIEAHSIQSASIVVLEVMLGKLIKSLISIERLNKEVHEK